MVLIPDFLTGFRSQELRRALGGKAGGDCAARGMIRPIGTKLRFGGGFGLFCMHQWHAGNTCETTAALAASAPEDPDEFEARVTSCSTATARGKKLKDLVAVTQQARTLVFSYGERGCFWHGFYSVEILEVLEDPFLARVKYVKQPVAADEVEAMRLGLAAARRALAQPKRAARGPPGAPDATDGAAPGGGRGGAKAARLGP